ncbi:MAG: Bifunctional protein Aas [Phycisphaerae bacterium]|nr:Bifunctional protein Aas [Phycisphaerae bacterium]
MNLLIAVLRFVVRSLLRLRYRIVVHGLDELARDGGGPVVFLPNHPALIDPIILLTLLHRRFRPRVLADAEQVDRFFIRRLAPRIGVRTIPAADVAVASRDRIEASLDALIGDLDAGQNILFYPAGHIYRQQAEDLRGNSAVETLLGRRPDARVVLVRTRGLWGSGFGFAAASRPPRVGPTLRRGALGLLASFIFFAPRRRVTITFHEAGPDDLPRPPRASRAAINAALERFYNVDAEPNTFVPYTLWGGRRRTRPEPARPRGDAEIGDVPDATRRLVLDHLRELSGRGEISPSDRLAHDLGLDSLARADLASWLAGEFGFAGFNPESLVTVADVMTAAIGHGVGGGGEVAPVPARWFAADARASQPRRLTLGDGATINDIFLARAARSPRQPVVADQRSGVRSFRDLITAALVLGPEIRRLEGERVGIMLPASVAASVAYLATLLAGRTPVMINWTLGRRSLAHCLESTGVKRVVTARALADRLAAQGVDFGEVTDRFAFIEDLAAGVGRGRKLWAWLRARLSWRSLRRAPAPEPAVILFTSGSETLPKAVPLTHANLLANIRDILEIISVSDADRMVGFLPPFHSFGLTATVLIPLLAGLPVVYHPNPTEGAALARVIEAYRVTLLLGTPTFLGGIARSAADGQLATLRIAVTGAEKCPDALYDALGRIAPGLTVLEGYGVTECSPIVAGNRPGMVRRGSIGTPLPSVQVAIVDAETRSRRVEPSRPGLLLVRGPSVFGGYLGQAASPFVPFEGQPWYNTGDLVSQDAEGVLTFRGRLKRFVKLGGEMVSLPAIEAALASAFGDGGEEGPSVAVTATEAAGPELVLFTTRDMDREAVNRLIRDAGLSPIHNVRRVVRVESIPLLGTGKTDYRALAERLSATSSKSGTEDPSPCQGEGGPDEVGAG